jgi:hypothetical protein
MIAGQAKSRQLSYGLLRKIKRLPIKGGSWSDAPHLNTLVEPDHRGVMLHIGLGVWVQAV